MRGVSNLLVIGTGGLGIWVVIILKHLLCNQTFKVTCVDTNKDKLDSAAALDADDVILWDSDETVETLVDNTTVSGYNRMDAVLDFVGTPKTVQTGFECLHRGGTLIVVGLQGGEIPISLPKLITKAVSIQGVRIAGQGVLKELIDLFAVQQIDTYPPIELIKLDQINEVHERLRKGQVKGRALIKYTE